MELGSSLISVIFLLSYVTASCSAAEGECDPLQYLELRSTSLIQCAFHSNYDSVLWYIDTDEEAILTYRNTMKGGKGYESGEFGIYPNGSLLIFNVSIKHETVFTVKKIISPSDPVILKVYSVHVKTIARPEYSFPVIQMCRTEYKICYMSATALSNLYCTVNNSRPEVRLNWINKLTLDNATISSPLEISTKNNVTFISKLSVSPSVCDSLLCLLACEATSTFRILERDESLILLEQSENDLFIKEPTSQFVESDSEMVLRCGDRETNLRVWKWRSRTKGPVVVLATTANIDEFVQSVYQNEFKISPNGSLFLRHTKVQHEGTYFCSIGNMEAIIAYDVRVYVNPRPPYVVVDGCNNQQYCTLTVERKGTLSCALYGIYPQVDIEWRSYQEGILFTEHDRKLEDKGDVMNVFLKSNFTISHKSGSRITVECGVTGKMTTLFQFSTSIDLISVTVDEQDGSGENNHSWLIPIAGVAFVICIISLIGIWKRKAFCECRDRTHGSEEEEIGLMEPTTISPEKQFIKELKTKYETMYNAVQPIPYVKDSMCCVDKIYVEGGIKTREEMTSVGKGKYQWKELACYNDIMCEAIIKSERKIIEAEPGYGKSTLSLQLAYDWCKQRESSPLTNIDIFIFLRLRQLESVSSIYAAVKLFLLPRDSRLSEDDVKELLSSSSSVVVLLDGYDEYPDQNIQDTDVSAILNKEMLQDAYVLLTTRSSSLPKRYAAQSARIILTGFNDESRDKYIRKAVVRNNDEETEKLKNKLQENAILNDLCQVPLLFVLFAHLAHNAEDFSDFKSVTSNFRHVIHCLHSHMKNKSGGKFDLLTTDHSELDKISLEALSKINPDVSWQRERLRNRLGDHLYNGYLQIGILVEEDTLTLINGTNSLNRLQNSKEVRFYHKVFCEWYAAHQFVDIVNTNPEALVSFFEKTEPTEVEYMYRFACGIDARAAVHITQKLEKMKDCKKFAILCTVEQDENNQDIVEVIKRLLSKQIILKEDSSRILQRSVMHLIEIASKQKIPVSELCLQNIFSHIGRDKKTINLKSGISLPATKTLEYLVIEEHGRELTVKETEGVISYALLSDRLRKVDFEGCIIPQNIPLGFLVDNQPPKGLEVMWGTNCRLNYQAGTWEKDQKILTDYEYNIRKSATRELYSYTDWQQHRTED